MAGPGRRKPLIRRRDGAGHLDPEYAAALLRESGKKRDADDGKAFLNGSRSTDALAEQLGEEWIETATSGEDEGNEVFDQKVPEEDGGPFVETTGNEEFAEGTDESNIEGATREPFPTT